MFRRLSVIGYLEVLKLPGVARPALGVAVASLPIGALSLAMLLLVEATTKRYAATGVVVGALALGTGLGILTQGRLMDRFGQPRVLITAVLLQTPALVAFVLALHPSGLPCGPTPLAFAPALHPGGLPLVPAPLAFALTLHPGGLPLVPAPLAFVLTLHPGGLPLVPALLAFVAGACEPQVGGALRALWPSLAPPRLRPTAMAWSSILLEAPVLAGPLLLAPGLALTGAAGAVLCCGGCFAVGALLLATSRPARSWRAGPRDDVGLLGALSSPAVRLLTAVAAAVGGVAGLTQFSAAAVANSAGAPGRATLLYAALSAGSLIGATAYGAHRWSGSPTRRLALMLTGLTAATLATVVAALARSAAAPLVSPATAGRGATTLEPLGTPTHGGAVAGLAYFGVGLFCCGLMLGPLMVACFSIVAEHIPPGTEVGGFTTLTAASLAANATATAIAGVVTDAGGPAAPLLAAALVAMAVTPLVLARRARAHIELQR